MAGTLSGVTLLAGYEFYALEPPLGVYIYKQPIQDALSVLASGVRNRHSREIFNTFRFVNVSVEPEHRLVPHDGIPSCGAAYRDHLKPGAPDAGAQIVVQCRREVESAAQRGDVQAEDRAV